MSVQVYENQHRLKLKLSSSVSGSLDILASLCRFNNRHTVLHTHNPAPIMTLLIHV